jgi:predicted metal-binding protein
VTSERPCLSVCLTCRDNEGARLHDALQPLMTNDVRLRSVICLANCEQGCSAAIQAPGKWSYLLGHLSPELAQDIAHYSELYALSPTGFVSRTARAQSLREAIVARVPAFPPPAAQPSAHTGDEPEMP